MTRRGFVLPLVVVSALLLASLVMTFHFISASDYKAMARIERSVQAGLLADLASDEVSSKVRAIKFGPRDPRPTWVEKLFAELAGMRADGPPFKTKTTVSFTLAGDLPQTQGAVTKTAGLLTVNAVEGKLGPFELMSPGGVGDLIYQETLFEDQKKDVRAWDLRGPLSVKVTIAGTRAPFDFSQDYQRGQELLLTDTTPVAGEFALFSFLPPPTTEYALSDMITGGKMLIEAGIDDTTSARVLVRGPLFMLPEDAPAIAPPPVPAPPPAVTPPHLSAKGDVPKPLAASKPSPNYQDGQWLDHFAMVPGPRVLFHTLRTIEANAPGKVGDLLRDVGEGYSPCRPGYVQSMSQLKTKAFPFSIAVIRNNLTGFITGNATSTITIPFSVPVIDWKIHHSSLALVKNFGQPSASFDTLDRDKTGYYPPQAYFHAPLASGQQRFLFQPSAPSSNTPKCYRGVKITGGTPEKWDGTVGADGDVVVAEPVPRAAQTPAANAGMIAVYGAAVFESQTIVALPIKQFTLWMMDLFIETSPIFNCFACGPIKTVAIQNRENAANQVLEQLLLDTSLTFAIRRFFDEAGWAIDRAPTILDVTELGRKLGASEAILAPYGAWLARGNPLEAYPQKAELEAAINTPAISGAPAEAALRQLLPLEKKPDFTSDFSSSVPSWTVGQLPPGDTPGRRYRTAMCADQGLKALKVMAPQAASQSAALTPLLDLAKDLRGIGPIPDKAGKRPEGVLGDYLAPPPAPVNAAVLKNDFPTGYYPPKYREWERIITRRYSDLDAYIAAEATGSGTSQVLELRGAVGIDLLRTTDNIAYRGRGIIFCTSTTAANQAKLAGNVAPVNDGDTGHHLTIVHRTTPEALKTGRPLPLVLGDQFRGTVYSDSGVQPSGASTKIHGNLVVGLLNKNQFDTKTVTVEYEKAILDAPPADIAKRWTVEMTGEVSSTQPTP